MKKDKIEFSIHRRIVVIEDERVEYSYNEGGEFPLVLVNGSGGPLEGWFRIIGELRASFSVLAYNRPGVGASTKPTRSQTGLECVSQLHRLIQALGVPTPFVLVGHSLGGLIADLYARVHPAQGAGLVLLESATADDIRRSHDQGRLRLRGTGAETDQVLVTAGQWRDAPPFPPCPCLVIAGTGRRLFSLVPRIERDARLAHQTALLTGRTGRLVLARHSGHFPQLTEPALVVDQVRQFAEALRPQH